MPKRKVTDDDIRQAAYHKWVEDGAPHGKDWDYWLAAEAELAPPAKKAAAKKPAAHKPAAKAGAAKKPAAKKLAAKKPGAKKTPAAKS